MLRRTTAFPCSQGRHGGLRSVASLLLIPCALLIGRSLRIAFVVIPRRESRDLDKDWLPTTYCEREDNDNGSTTRACGRCPELIASAKYFLRQYQDTYSSIDYKVQMIQLVGTWPNDPTMERLMHQVFLHNQQLIQRHHRNAPEPVAIVEPPRIAASCRHGSFPEEASPAFWKIMAVHQQCTTTTTATVTAGPPDLVWFLDGDALVMDSTARVDFLWDYHRYLLTKERSSPSSSRVDDDASLDMLFAHGRNGYNSGIFIVNCNSPTALKALELWHDAALDVWLWSRQLVDRANVTDRANPKYRLPFQYEQNALHYMLNTYQWQRAQGTTPSKSQAVPRLRNTIQSPRIWDARYAFDYSHAFPLTDGNANHSSSSSNNNSPADLFTSRALRRRMRHTTQCALQTFSSSALRKYQRVQPQAYALAVYRPGHFILHTAGVPRAQREAILQRAIAAPPNDAPTLLAPRQAAQVYLQTHNFSYAFNETYMDWDYPGAR